MAENGRKRNGERGMAIVMVLGVVAVVLLMVVHAMTICEVIGRDSYTTASRTELKYQAESAADHAFWLHLTDRRMFPTRNLGTDDVARDSYDLEPWMADRREHRVFDRNCYVYISTVEKTVRLDSLESFKANVTADDTEQLELIDDFLDVLEDYTDADSLARLYGKESGDYENEGYAALPRNAGMQFAEEVFWIDGWQDVVKSEVTIVPPKGKSLDTNSKTSFFSASPYEIQSALDLSDDELQNVLDARDNWIADGTSLEESLSSDLYANILMKFNFRESNVAEYIVSAATDNGEMRVIYDNVREVNFSRSTIYADSEHQALSIWKRIAY